jgi:hypothetical protein
MVEKIGTGGHGNLADQGQGKQGDKQSRQAFHFLGSRVV